MVDKKNEQNLKDIQKEDTAKKGFASMSTEKIQEIASKGGTASAEKAGYKGMAARGRKGGLISSQKAGHEGMAARGHKGGVVSAQRAGREGMAARGRKGGSASSTVSDEKDKR